MKSLIALFLISLFSLSLYSQNLDELPVETRDSILVVRTKTAVMKHGPEFWRDYKAPKINRFSQCWQKVLYGKHSL